AKKVNLGAKLNSASAPKNVDQWVSNRFEAELGSEPEPIKMKRLTLDIPESLHRAIKLKATAEGVAMVDLLRDLLEKEYGNQ
ncbi:toxin-antitoxin system HicB family antitoxin, partial [Corallococcus praedator]